MEHLLDHTPPAGRVGPLRLDDKRVPDVSDHANEVARYGGCGTRDQLSWPDRDRRDTARYGDSTRTRESPRSQDERALYADGWTLAHRGHVARNLSALGLHRQKSDASKSECG